MQTRIGFSLELLDIIAVGPGEDLPVHTLQVIAGRIGPVLHEVHAEALVRASVQAGQESLDHAARQEFQAGYPGKYLWRDESACWPPASVLAVRVRPRAVLRFRLLYTPDCPCSRWQCRPAACLFRRRLPGAASGCPLCRLPRLGADALNRHEGVCSVRGDGAVAGNIAAVGDAASLRAGGHIEYARGGCRLERCDEIAAIRRYAQAAGRIQVDFHEFVPAGICHVHQRPAQVGFNPGRLAARFPVGGASSGRRQTCALTIASTWLTPQPPSSTSQAKRPPVPCTSPHAYDAPSFANDGVGIGFQLVAPECKQPFPVEQRADVLALLAGICFLTESGALTLQGIDEAGPVELLAEAACRLSRYSVT